MLVKHVAQTDGDNFLMATFILLRWEQRFPAWVVMSLDISLSRIHQEEDFQSHRIISKYVFR